VFSKNKNIELDTRRWEGMDHGLTSNNNELIINAFSSGFKKY
jgi:hypothetical protein